MEHKRGIVRKMESKKVEAESMENKREIIRAINNLTYSVIKKVKKHEDDLIEKVLIDYLGKKPTKKLMSRVSKIINDGEKDFILRFDEVHLGAIKYEMTKENGLSIKFVPNAVE